MQEEITNKAEQAIQNKVFPGCVVGVVKTSGERFVLPLGRFTYESDANEVKGETIFDVASLTKSIPTGSLALKLIDEGKLGLDDRIIDHLPEFQNLEREKALIRHLLTYTVLLKRQSMASFDNPDELLKQILTSEFRYPPGTYFQYSNTGAALLGMVIEKITGETIDVLGDRYFFKPLNMTRTTFHPDTFSLEEVVPTEKDQRGLVHRVVHDESAWIFRTKANRVMGHAGLFSTAPDVLNFLEMLLNQGRLNGGQYFSRKIVEQMHTNQIEKLGDYTGVGWELYQPRYMGKHSTPDTFGKTGFTGCLCVCDIEKQVGYVILSNRIYPRRPEDSTAINTFRADIGNIVLKNT